MLGETIAVVDKSGKVMKHSTHLINVFKEARSAYQERKAEIVAARQQLESPKHRPRRAYTIQDDISISSSRHSRRSRRDGAGEKKHSHRRHHSGGPPKKRSVYPESEAAFETKFKDPWSPTSPTSPASPATPRTPRTPRTPHTPNEGVSRSHTVKAVGVRDSYFPPLVQTRSKSMGAVDMDLAYGEPPPNLFTSQAEEEAELKGLVGRVRGLLDEANCLQYSATQTIQVLQKNPDAMAAVALSLAEISSLVKKMSPLVVLKLKTLAPSVFALLSSPQFMVATGVAVGVTIVAFGGYKIVKKIQEKRVTEEPVEQMIDITEDVSRVESWRRGVAMIEAESVGTSVDGELITPTAASMSKLNLRDGAHGSESGHKSKHRSTRTAKSTKSTKTTKTSKSSTSKSKTERGSKDRTTRTLKEKKPSPLRLMFG